MLITDDSWTSKAGYYTVVEMRFKRRCCRLLFLHRTQHSSSSSNNSVTVKHGFISAFMFIPRYVSIPAGFRGSATHSHLAQLVSIIHQWTYRRRRRSERRSVVEVKRQQRPGWGAARARWPECRRTEPGFHRPLRLKLNKANYSITDRFEYSIVSGRQFNPQLFVQPVLSYYRR